MVGNRDPMGVAADIVEHLLRTDKGRFRVDHPFGLPDTLEMVRKTARLGQGLECSGEVELTRVEGLLNRAEEEASEQAREDPNGEKEAGAAADRYVMLSPTLLQGLREWWRGTRPTAWLFPGQRSDHPMDKGAVQWACRLARFRSGLVKPVTPHSLRYAFAVHLLESGTDLRTIQLLLGHRQLETTSRYLRLATTKVCAATSPLDLLPRPGTTSPIRRP